MSLGRNPSDIRQDLAVARRAMDARVWFHSSPTYNNGFAFMVLRQAFDEDRSRVPRMLMEAPHPPHTWKRSWMPPSRRFRFLPRFWRRLGHCRPGIDTGYPEVQILYALRAL